MENKNQGVNATPVGSEDQANMYSSSMPAGSDAQELGALSLDPATQPYAPAAQPENKSTVLGRVLKRADIALVVLLVIGLIGIVINTSSKKPAANNSAANISGKYGTQEVPLEGFIANQQGVNFGNSKVVINGPLSLNNGLVVTPSLQPNKPTAGQLYFDQNTNQLAYYNGTAFVPLTAQQSSVQSIGGATGALTLGGGLTVVGNQITATYPVGVSSFGGQTGAIAVGSGLTLAGNTLVNGGILNVLAGTNIAVSNDGNGNVTVSNTGAGTGTITSGGGANGTIPLFTGAQNIENSIVTQAGGAIAVAGNLSTTGALTLGTALSVANGGTGATNLSTNGVLVGNGAGAITSVTAAGSGLCLMSTVGAPAFAACPGGGGGSVTSLNGLTGALSIANASAAGSTVTIDDATAAAKGIASFDPTDFTVTAGAVSTIQDLDSSATPTFAGVNTNNITPSAALTIGISAQTALLQGSTTTITSNGVGNDIVLNSADTIELQDNTNVTGNISTTGDVAVNGGDLTSSGALNITTGGTLTAGTSAQTLTMQGNAGTSLRATNGANTTVVGFTSPTANTTLNFPALSAGTYTICTTSGNCAGAAATLQSAYDNSTNPEIVVDATRGAVSIRDAGSAIGANLLEVQSNNGATTYLGVTASGVTVTGTTTASGNINSTGGALQTGGTTRVDNTGNLTNIGALTLSGTISGGTSITSSGAINTTGGVLQTNSTTRIDNSGNLTNIGTITASGSATLQGGGLTLGTNAQAGSVVISDGSSNTATLLSAALGQNTQYTLPDPGSASVSICLSSGNCVGSGGGVSTAGGTNNRISKFNGSQTITDSSITDDGVTVTTTADLAVNGGDITSSGALNITPGGALTVGISAQTALLQGSTTTITSSGAGNDIVLNSADTIELQDNTNVTGNVTATGDIAVNGGDLTSTGALNITTGGALSVGASAQNLTLQGNGSTSLRATASGNTTIVGFTSPTANTTLNFPALSAGTYTICTTSGNCSGAAATLQSAYDNSTNPEIILDATRGAVTIRDASSALGANLLEVQSNDGATTYLAVTATGVAVTGTASISGNINTTGGALQTNGTTRVDNSGNATNIGNLGLSGTISGGTSVTGSGNFNSTGGALQTNSTTRVDNSGNLTNIGTLTLSGAISGGTTYSGSGNINTTGGVIQTNSTTRIDNAGNLTNIGTITASGSATLQGGSLTLGTNAQAGTLLISDGSSNTGTIQTAALGQNTTYTLPDPGAGSATICLSTGNCAGSGGGVTTVGGTTNTLAKFTGSQTIGDSIITDNGTTVTIAGVLSVNTLTPTGAFTAGSTSQTATLQGSTTTITSTGAGNDVVINSADTIELQDSTNITGNLDASGTLTAGTANAFQVGATGDITTTGNATIQGGNTTIGTTGQQGSLVLHDGNGQTATISVGSALVGNTALAIPTGVGVSDTFCLQTLNNCAGSAVSLQSAYDNSTNPEIILDATRGAVTIRDNATPIAANLLEVQNNGGGTTYFAVTTSGVAVTGTATASGNINSTGGALQTNSTTRIDNAGNATNIGNLGLSGTISGGTSVTGSGNFNTTGGALQTNSTSRIDNSGNLVNIGNLTATGAITIASVGAGNDVIIDGADQFIVQDTAVFNGLGTFNTDVDFTLADTENVNVTSTVTGSSAVNLISGVLTNNSTSGVQQALFLQNASGSGSTEALAALDNADPDTALASGILVTSSAAGITTAIDVSDSDIVTALSFGANDIDGASFDITGATGSFTSAGSGTLQGGVITLGTTSQAGTVVISDGSSNTGTIQTAALGQNTTYTLPDPGAGTATICLSTGNCAGSGGGVTGSGTNNRLSKFTSTGSTIGDSTITDNGTSVTTSVDVVIQGGDLTVGTASQNGSLILHDGNGQTTTIQAGDSGSNLTFIFPTSAGGTNQCLKQSGTGNQLFWDNCTGGAGGSSTLQSAYDAGQSITTSDNRDIDIVLANTTTDSNFDLVIADGSTGYVSFTRANGAGTTDPAQFLLIDNLDTNRAIPTGIKIQAAAGGITTGIDATDSDLGTALAVGINDIQGTTGNIDFTNFDVNGSTGDVTAGLYNGQTISSSASFTGTVAVAGNTTLTGDIAVNGGDITSTGGLNVSASGGTLVVGSTAQTTTMQGNAATTINATNAGSTTTISFQTPTANVNYRLPTATAGSYDICTTSGNCNGAGVTLQSAYNSSTNPEIVLDATRGGLTIRDNATPLGGNLLEVQNNGGGTNYFVVTATGISVTGTATATGNINTTGGTIQTNSTNRIDNSGNLVNIGNLTLSGAISGGTTYAGSGNINTTGGALQTNSITRVDNSGNLTNVGNLTASGAITIASTGAGNDIIINGADILDVQDATTFASTTSFNGVATFNTSANFALADAENIVVTNTVTGTNSLDLLSVALTNNTTSGTQRAGFIQNTAGTGVTEALLVLDNADTDTAVTAGLQITSAAGSIQTAVDLSDSDIVDALNVGANNIIGTTGNLDFTNFDVVGATGVVTAGTYNGQTISSAASLTGTLAVAGNTTLTGDIAVNGGDITASGALNITPGGALVVGATGQSATLQGNASTTITATNGGNTTTLSFQSPTANVNYRFATAAAGNYDICTTAGNCTGTAVTLQSAYNNSTNPEIVVDATRGALTVRDNATPIAANLFEVQSNNGGTTYFGVTASGTSTTGTSTTSGNINTSGGVLQTNSTTRIDNSGNLTNIGNLTLSGAISGGTSYSGSGNINSTGGALQTASTTRVDNSGNLTNIGNITGTGAITIASTGPGNDIILNSADTIELQDNTNVTGNFVASGTATIQGASATIGTTSQQGSLVLHDGNGQTASISVGSALATNTSLAIPTTVSASDTFCLQTLGNCSGAAATLQSVYNNSSNPELIVDATRGALTVRDNASAIGANLLEVQNNTGSTTYLAVTVSGLVVTGTATVSGDVNTSGGVLQTNSVTRIDNSGNATNIGNVSLSGSISGGTSYSGSGNINTTGGALQTNSTTRVDNSGNLVNIGSITGNGGMTIASTGAGNDIYIDGADEFIVQDASVFDGTVAFNSDVDLTLSGAENLAVTGTVTGTTATNLINGVITNNTTSGNQNVMLLQNLAGSGTTENLLVLDNTDTDTAVSGGLTIISSAGGITNAIDVSDSDIGAALLFGANDISGSNFNIFGSTGNFTSAGSGILQGGAVTLGTTSQQGSLVLHDGNGQTATISVGSALAANTALAIPTGVGVSDTICLLTLANCTGSGVTGSGTTNRMTKFTGTGTVGNSSVVDDASSLTIDTNVDILLQGSSAYISNAQGQTASEAFGLNATVGGANALAIGNGATVGAHAGSIAIGSGATTTAAGQLVIGASGNAITQAVIGNGVTNVAPSGFTLQGTSGSGSNVAGASVTIAGGRGTGTGNGGSVNFQIANPGSTGSGLNTLATVFSLQGANGSASFQNTTDSTQAFNVKNMSAGNLLTVDTSNSRVGINLGGSNTPTLATGVAGLEIQGALRLSGGAGAGMSDLFAANTGNVGAKLNIPYTQFSGLASGIVVGVDDTSHVTSRGISVFDERNLQHSPSIAVVSPDEGKVFGLSWEGSTSTIGYLKTVGSSSITISPNEVDAATFSTTAVTLGQNTTLAASKTLTVTSGLTALTGNTTGDALNVSNSTSTGNIAVFSDNSTAVATIADGGATTFKNSTNSATAFQIQDSAAAPLLSANTLTRTGGVAGNLLKVGNSTGTDTDLTVLQLDGVSADPTTNLASLNGGLFYNSNTNKVSIVENGVVKVLCNKTDLSCGAGATTTLQNAYDDDVNGSDTTITLSANDDSLVFSNPASAGTDSAFLLQLNQQNTTAAVSAVDIIQASNNSNAVNVTANAIDGETALAITANALTTGKGISVASSGTGLTTGSLLHVSSATTSAVNTNGIVSFQATGNYTSTSNNGLVNVLANSTTAGTIMNIQGTALTSGTALNIAANTGTAINVSSGLTTLTAPTSGSGATLTVSNSTSTGSIAVFKDNATAVATIADGGATTFRNVSDSAGAFQIQNAAGTTTLLSADTASLRLNIDGDLVLAKRTDAGGTTADWTNAYGTTGTPCTQASVDSVKSSATFNGSLYIGTSEADKAEVCRFDGGTTWTRVNSAAGTFGSNNNTDTVTSMIVYNGYLYVATGGGAAGTGTDTNAASLYRYDGGTTFTRVNTTQGTLVSANINGISSMVVYRGGLYLGTAEPANTEVYRYAGGSTFIDMVAPFGTSGQDQVSSMASYDGMLVIGLGGTAGNAAGLYMYGGESVGWQLRNGGAAGNVDGVSSGMDDIPSMSVYGNALYLSTSDGVNSARWYRYNNAGNATTSFTAMHTSAGTLVSGGTGSIESIATMTAYNGNLYLGTQESNGAEVYKYDGATVSKVSQTTAGTIKASGTASIDGVTTMAAFNDLLFVGTNESNSAQLYTYNAVEGQSRTLRFAASSDNAGSTEQAGFPNEGSIFFAAEASTGANLQGAATGTFVFSHGITVTAGAYDLAEDYPTRDDSLVAGDLVSVDPNERGFVRKATGAYDPGIVGVYSAKPALRIGQADATINGGRAVPIALAGRVPLKVSTENGAIKPGDPLAASSVPGVAMKATATGRIVGMAMESYDGQGEGMITVFVNPNFYGAAGGLQGTGDVSSLLVHGDATIDGDLTVVGTATVGALVTEELTVSGTAHVQDLYVGGSLVLGSSTEDPTAQAAHPITQRFKASKPIVAGSVVIVDTLPGWVTTTTSAGDTRVVGVATTGATSAGQVIEVAIGGTAKVSVEGTVAPGQLLRADASEGHASVASSPGWGELVGKVIGTPDNNGKVLLLITLQ